MGIRRFISPFRRNQLKAKTWWKFLTKEKKIKLSVRINTTPENISITQIQNLYNEEKFS